MSRKQKNHIPGIAERLTDFAESRMLDIKQHTPYQLQITDGGYVKVDLYTTGRYYIVMTDYSEMTDDNIVERQGEKGQLPTDMLEEFLDDIFFPGMKDNG